MVRECMLMCFCYSHVLTQRIGLYNQHAADQLELSKSPVEYLQSKFNTEYQLARKTLGRYGLPGHAHTIKIRDLSGSIKIVFDAVVLFMY